MFSFKEFLQLSFNLKIVTAAPRLAFWFLWADKRKSCSEGSWVITALLQVTVGRIAYKDGNESLVPLTL